MKFSHDFEYDIVKAVESENVYNLQTFFSVFCKDYANLEDNIVKVNDRKYFMRLTQKFISMCKRLENAGIITTVIMSQEQNTKIFELNDAKTDFISFRNANDLISMYQKKRIIPLALTDFIENDLQTNDEYYQNELLKSNKKSFGWTKTVAIISIIVSLITILFQFLTYSKYTNERNVRILNPGSISDTTNVILLEPQSIQKEN